jgi:predicted small lipoprotein YifL
MPNFTGRYAKSVLFVGVIATLIFSGCGLKGPLYRTDENAQRGEHSDSSTARRKKNPFDRRPAPQSQKQESTTGTPGDAPPAVDPDRPATPSPTPTP